MKTIAIIAEYTETFEPHAATNRAIEHSREALGLDIAYKWISTADITDDMYQQYDSLWVAPGSPYKDMAKTLWAIRYAREQRIPVLGTCGGFQHIMLEYARNILMIEDAQHAEYDPYASRLFISQLACSLAGRAMELHLASGSHVSEIYGTTTAKERYYCNFSVNPQYLDAIKQGPISIAGSDAEGEVRIVEYPNHPFFIATLFVPQALSSQDKPHPLVNAFLQATEKAEQGTPECRP